MPPLFQSPPQILTSLLSTLPPSIPSTPITSTWYSLPPPPPSPSSPTTSTQLQPAEAYGVPTAVLEGVKGMRAASAGLEGCLVKLGLLGDICLKELKGLDSKGKQNNRIRKHRSVGDIINDVNGLLEEIVQTSTSFVAYTCMFLGLQEADITFSNEQKKALPVYTGSTGLSLILYDSTRSKVNAILEGLEALVVRMELEFSLAVGVYEGLFPDVAKLVGELNLDSEAPPPPPPSTTSNASTSTTTLDFLQQIAFTISQCTAFTNPSITPLSNKVFIRRECLKSITEITSVISELETNCKPSEIGQNAYYEDLEYYEFITRDDFYDLLDEHDTNTAKFISIAASQPQHDLLLTKCNRISETFCKTDYTLVNSCKQLISVWGLELSNLLMSLLDSIASNLSHANKVTYIPEILNFQASLKRLSVAVTAFGCNLYPESLDVGDDEKGLEFSLGVFGGVVNEIVTSISKNKIEWGTFHDSVSMWAGGECGQEAKVEVVNWIGKSRTLQEEYS